MRGRPKKDNPRNIIYKVRLNKEENEMLMKASMWTSQAKSEVFRKALIDYYNSIEINKYLLSGEKDWELDHISQQRMVQCPYSDCREEFPVDFSLYSNPQESEGPMGLRLEYIIDVNILKCPTCLKPIHVKGVISEYPIGAYEYERICVEEGKE